MWSLFAKRLTISAVVSVAARTAHPATFPLSAVARRTLFATTQLNFPPAKAAESIAKKTTGKTAETKGKRATPAKRGRPPKDTQQKSSKEKTPKKQRLNIPKSLKPPKRAPNPYALFYASFIKSQPKTNSLLETQELSKQASAIWNGYSMAEKQPFYDESEAKKVQAKQERDEFFENTSLSDLRQLNAIRKVQGKHKYHRTKKSSTPPTAFILFSQDFRNSPDGQAIIDQVSPEKKHVVQIAVAAGQRWRSMSAEEKAPYFEKFQKAKEECEAQHPQT